MKPFTLRSLLPYQRVNHFPRFERIHSSWSSDQIIVSMFIQTNRLDLMKWHEKIVSIRMSKRCNKKKEWKISILFRQHFFCRMNLKIFQVNLILTWNRLYSMNLILISAAFQREKGLWIIKPVASSQGKGIFLINHVNKSIVEREWRIYRFDLARSSSSRWKSRYKSICWQSIIDRWFHYDLWIHFETNFFFVFFFFSFLFFRI